MRDIKEKDAIDKAKITKRVTFAEEIPKSTFFRKSDIFRSVDSSKPRSADLTYNTDQKDRNCFHCHQPGYSARECSTRATKVNAVDDDEKDEYDRSASESDSDSKN